jgi:hypothetical protein
MYSKYWLIIKDDSKKTFEVCGQATNDNAFFNKTYAMQRAGMNVSCVVPPVTNKTSNKELIKISGYTKEDGLQERLSKQYREITMKFSEENEFDSEG